MKKTILLAFSLLIVSLFLISCVPKEFSDEELDAVMAKEDNALSGQASKSPSADIDINYLSCTDTDSGKDYAQKGTIEVEYSPKSRFLSIGSDVNTKPKSSPAKTYTRSDKCSDNKKLLEYFCVGKVPKTELKSCENSCEKDICTVSVCGNGKIESGEGCDDGNKEVGDGCGPSCLVEPDTDGDGFFDSVDNCPAISNPNQKSVWNAAKGGLASASSFYQPYFHPPHYPDTAGSLPAYAFDGYIEDGWMSFEPSAQKFPATWLEYDFGNGNEKVITGYQLLAAYDEIPAGFGENHNPKSWTFEGYVNNKRVVLDTISEGNLTIMPKGSSEIEKYFKQFLFKNNAAYQKFRIKITSNEDPQKNSMNTHITEMKMLACE